MHSFMATELTTYLNDECAFEPMEAFPPWFLALILWATKLKGTFGVADEIKAVRIESSGLGDAIRLINEAASTAALFESIFTRDFDSALRHAAGAPRDCLSTFGQSPLTHACMVKTGAEALVAGLLALGYRHDVAGCPSQQTPLPCAASVRVRGGQRRERAALTARLLASLARAACR